MTKLYLRTHIETPENALLSFRIAGPGGRMGAYLLDFVFRLIIIIVFGYVAELFSVFSLSDLTMGLQLLLFFFLEWGYASLFEGFWNGRTPGKHLLGLRVIKEGGYSMSFFDALLRNLLRAADFLPIFYGVGFVVMFWSAKMQRLGDLVAGTIVVREQRQTLGRDLDWLDKVEAIPTTDFEKYHVPSERALSLIEKFLRRNEGLENARSNEIAAILARPLAERLGYRDQDREQIERPVLFLTRLFRTFWHGVRGEDQRNKTVRREVTVAPREEL